jgi:YHS domain-containing protein
MRARRSLLANIVAVIVGVGVYGAVVGAADPSPAAAAAACPVAAPRIFEPPHYIDVTRAGGEPIVALHPDGTVLVGAHAGTTHFFGPAAPDPDTAAFIQNYRGQAYFYWSENDGKTFQITTRDDPNKNRDGSGFSDPDFAIDSAGAVYSPRSTS